MNNQRPRGFVRICRRILFPSLLDSACLFLLGSLAAKAADGSWTANANGNWSDTTKWAGGIVADGASSTATFDLDITADRTVTLDISPTLGQLVFRDTALASNAYIFGGSANTLTLDNGANKPVISVYPRSGDGIVARIDRPFAGSNGFQLLAPGGKASLGLGNIANTFSGAVVVGNGSDLVMLRTDNNDSLGGRDALTAATDSSSLAVSHYTQINSGGTLNINGNRNLGTELVKVQGAGWDGNGALTNTSTTGAQNAFQQVQLLGDTTFGGAGRWDIRTGTAATGRLFQDGFTLTKTGANQVSLVNVNVIGGGDINVNQGVFAIEVGSIIGGPGTIRVNTGGSLNWWANTGAITRDISMDGGAMSDPNTTTNATIASKILLNSPNTTINKAGTTAQLILNGVISGSGNIAKTGTGTLVLNGANTFSGNVAVNAGTLVVGSSGILPATDLTVASGAALDVSALASPYTTAGGSTFTVGRSGSVANDIIGAFAIGTGTNVELGSSARNGGSNVERTATFGGNLSLAGGGTVFYDLGDNPAAPQDLISVTGNLSLAGTTTIRVTPSSGGFDPGTYALATCTGSLTGDTTNLTLAGLPAGTRQTFIFDTTGIPNQISLVVTGTVADLVWAGNGTTNVWDLNTTANFTNGGSPDVAKNLDRVTFDNSGSDSPAVDLQGTLQTGLITVKATTKNYTIGGTGTLAGASSLFLADTNTSTFTITGSNHDFSGSVTVWGGTLAATTLGNAGAASSLGIAPAVTLDGGGLTILGPSQSSDKTLGIGTLGGTLTVPNAGSTLTLVTPTSGTTDLKVEGAGAVRFGRNDSTFTFTTPLAGSGNVILNPRIAGGATTSIDLNMGSDNTDFAGTLTLQSPATGTYRTTNLAQLDLGTADVFVENNAQLWVTSGQIIANDVTIAGLGFVESNGTAIGALRGEGATIRDSALTVKGTAKIGAHNGTLTLANETIRGTTTGGGDDTLVVGGTNYGNNYTVQLTEGTTLDAATLDKLVIGGGGSTANAQTLVVGNLTTSANLGTVPVELGVAGNNQNSTLRFQQADDYVLATNFTAAGSNTSVHIDTPPGASSGKGIVFSGNTLSTHYLGVGTGNSASPSTSKLTIEAGTTLAVITNFFLGEQNGRTGIVDQTGGDVSVGGQFRAGHWPSETSTYNLAAGTLTLTADSPAANPSGGGEQNGGIYLGVDGTGVFTQTGGTVATNFVVLDNRGDTAGTDTYQLDGGTLALKSSWGIAARNASSAFNLGGGTVRIDNTGTGTGTGADITVPIDATLTVSGSASALDTNGPGNGFSLKRDVLGTGATLTTTGGGTLYLDTAGTQTIEANLAGTSQVVKTGTGTTTLAGANTYTGTTTVSAGTLLVNGSLASPSLSVAPTATVGGSGTINAAVTFGEGATLAPGTSPGTLTMAGALTLADATILAFELNPLDQTVGAGINDLVDGVTNLTLDGLLNVTPTSGDFAGVTSGAWRLFNYSGSLTDNTVNLNLMPALDPGATWKIDTSSPNQVNLLIVPEPSAALLAALGSLGLALRRRREP